MAFLFKKKKTPAGAPARSPGYLGRCKAEAVEGHSALPLDLHTLALTMRFRCLSTRQTACHRPSMEDQHQIREHQRWAYAGGVSPRRGPPAGSSQNDLQQASTSARAHPSDARRITPPRPAGRSRFTRGRTAVRAPTQPSTAAGPVPPGRKLTRHSTLHPASQS